MASSGLARPDAPHDDGAGPRDAAASCSAVASRNHEVHRGVGKLLQEARALGSDRLWSLDARAVSESLREVYALQARLAELRSALLVQAERVDLMTWDAHPNLVSWLRNRVGLAPGEAKKHVGLARSLDQHPVVAEALAAGVCPEASAQVIVSAVDALPPDLVDAQVREKAVAHLVAAAQVHDTRTLARLSAHLDEVLDPEGADRRLAVQLDAAEARAARRTFFTLSHDEDRQITDGAFRIPLRHGIALGRMLESLLNPARPDPIAATDTATGEPVPAEQRRGHAFAQLIDRTGATDLPRTGGSTTTVVVTMTVNTLLGGLSSARLDTGHRLAPAAARRLSAEHGVIPAVLGTRSEVLDLGRRARLFTPKQRLAMTIQQHGTCAVDSCDRPAAWGEAHHLEPWHTGGPTDLANGALVCARHHTLADHPAYDTTVAAPGRIRINRRE